MTPAFIRPDWPAPASVIALSTLRGGGNSRGEFASLNLGDHVEDDPRAVAANRAALARWLPEQTRIQWLSQVHGTRVIRSDRTRGCPSADASYSRVPGQACAVLTADCLPVLLCSREGDVVAAAHAGWRGLLAGVLERTVAAVRASADGVQAAEPAALLAWLGPAIGPGAFEVGIEVRAAFMQAAPAADRAATAACFAANPARPGHYLADLYALARLRLGAVGVSDVYGGGYCTFTAADRYFSYRRDGRTGRMASVILLDPGPCR